MKIIGSVKEDLNIERRISITPETVKKFVDLNFSVFIEKNYGSHLGISDEEYVDQGANFKNSAKEVLEKTEKFNCTNFFTVSGVIAILFSLVRSSLTDPMIFIISV